VNGWLVAATALLPGLLVCGLVAVRGSLGDALVAAEIAGALATTVLVCLAMGFAQAVYWDLAIVLAGVQWIGALCFARFLERAL
jgi:multisubunit Na+/H+ antiporter MnhF subunit